MNNLLRSTATLSLAGLLSMSATASAQAESLTPHTHASGVPQTAEDLWNDDDPRKDNVYYYRAIEAGEAKIFVDATYEGDLLAAAGYLIMSGGNLPPSTARP